MLDARLRTDADNVLRERAATVLRGLGTVDGRLSVIEAPDQGAIDAQTWIFAGQRPLEQPAHVDPRNQRQADARAAPAGFSTEDATDTRLYAAPVRQGGRRLGTVVVGASLAPYESTASSALLGSVILGLLTLAAIAALSRWLISRALRPVAQMTAQAADWGEHDLSRRFFAGEPHDELSALASVFDGLLSRLAQSLRREQRLTAEVSHELRTPLAKILAEAELAASRERSSQQYRASLELIRRHAQDLQRVLETLLASARAEVSPRSIATDARQSAERSAAPLRWTPSRRRASRSSSSACDASRWPSRPTWSSASSRRCSRTPPASPGTTSRSTYEQATARWCSRSATTARASTLATGSGSSIRASAAPNRTRKPMSGRGSVYRSLVVSHAPPGG